MRDSSAGDRSAFAGLHLAQIEVLLGLLGDLDLTSPGNIERRYAERAAGFEATLSFLTAVGAIEKAQGSLSVVRHLAEHPVEDAESLPRRLIDMMVARDTLYRSEVFSYLRRFEVRSGIAEYRPEQERRSSESAVRNFLMELGLVWYDEAGDRYGLSHLGAVVYAAAACGPAVVSPSQLQARQQRREMIGSAAEVAVLAYEIERVGPRFAAEVEHVAAYNAASGYDIRSVTLCAGDTIVPRYIEVKAVSTETYQFYWSSNERDVAETLRSWYYLYLVPVDGSGAPAIQRLCILSDPCRSVLGNPGVWTVEADVLQCFHRSVG